MEERRGWDGMGWDGCWIHPLFISRDDTTRMQLPFLEFPKQAAVLHLYAEGAFSYLIYPQETPLPSQLSLVIYTEKKRRRKRLILGPLPPPCPVRNALLSVGIYHGDENQIRSDQPTIYIYIYIK